MVDLIWFDLLWFGVVSNFLNAGSGAGGWLGKVGVCHDVVWVARKFTCATVKLRRSKAVSGACMGLEEIQPRKGKFQHQCQEVQRQPSYPTRSTEPTEIVLSWAFEAPLGMLLSRGIEKVLEEFVQPRPGHLLRNLNLYLCEFSLFPWHSRFSCCRKALKSWEHPGEGSADLIYQLLESQDRWGNSDVKCSSHVISSISQGQILLPDLHSFYFCILPISIMEVMRCDQGKLWQQHCLLVLFFFPT